MIDLLLAGDVGGTKTDLGIYSATAGPRAPLARSRYVTAAWPSLVAMAEHFLGAVGQRVDSACFAVAGPVVRGRAVGTNLSWVLDEQELAAALGLRTVHLLNDVEAIANAVPALPSSDVHAINRGAPVEGAAIAVIAPGTGLGEAFLTWDGARYRPYPSEGGHADFAPATPQQADLLAWLAGRMEHVSVERVCSGGQGIPNLYAFLRDSGRIPESPELARTLSGASEPGRVITDGALRRPSPDPLCVATLELFISILGGEAGNLALKVLATGGVYLGGGIVPRLPPLLDRGFMGAFVAKGRMGGLLGRVPVHVVLSRAALPGAAIQGLALMAEEWRAVCKSG